MRSARTAANYPGCPQTVTDAVGRGSFLRPARWGLWDAVVGPVGFVVFSLAVVIGGVSTGMSVGTVVLLSLVVPWIPLAGWPLIATFWRGNGLIDLGIRLRWTDVGWGVLYGLIALFAAGFIAVITQYLFGDFTSSAAEVAGAVTSMGPLAVLFFALCLTVGAPVVEELAFRGLGFAAVRKRGANAAWTIVITAVAFSAFHFEPVRFAILLSTGLVLGVARWHTGALGAAMVAHGVNNLPGGLSVIFGWGS